MPTELQRIALQAVSEVGANPHGGIVIQASKLARDRSGSNLNDVIEAVKWAIDHPAAEMLPERSIVATADSVYIKLASDEPTLPWRELTDGKYLNYAGNEEVDDFIQSGEATILRVGDGS